ncbi:hypothetical protein VPH35_062969 [Triticum aestivum]
MYTLICPSDSPPGGGRTVPWTVSRTALREDLRNSDGHSDSPSGGPLKLGQSHGQPLRSNSQHDSSRSCHGIPAGDHGDASRPWPPGGDHHLGDPRPSPPKSLLRCRAVCRVWRHATTHRQFLLAHHVRQPSLPIVFSYGNEIGKKIATLDHRAGAHDAQLQPIDLSDQIFLVASSDGLLILYKYGTDASRCFFVYNPTMRQHSPIQQLLGFNIMGMYPHRPTGEYRLLLQNSSQDQIGCYVFALGSDQPPRYIGWPEKASEWFIVPVRVHDSLHWYPIYLSKQTEPVMVFDTMSESFRQMHAPIIPTKACMFEMDDTLGIYSCNTTLEIVNIWVLHNYQSEVWNLKYRVALPIAEIREKFDDHDAYWNANVASDVLLLVGHDWRLPQMWWF